MSEDFESYFHKINFAIAARDDELVAELSDKVHHADLAAIYEDLGEEERPFLTAALGAVRFSKILPEIPDLLVGHALEQFSEAEQLAILGSLPDDDRVDVLQDLSEEKRQGLLELLDEKTRDNTRILLRYGRETAGGRMTTQIGRISETMTVKEAIDHLRADLESTKTLARIFVVDGDGRLIGKIRLRDLAFNEWDTPIRDLFAPMEIRILASADQEEAANMLSRYDLFLLPVVDEFQRLLGVITSDDAIEIIEAESTEDMEKGAGISGEQSEQTYLNTSIKDHFRRRCPWLVILGFLAILSGFVMMRFEETLTSVYLLSLFLPMVVAAGGNTGGQASTMVIRAMALGELHPEDTWRVAGKELRLGVLLGGFLGLIIGVFAVFAPPALHYTLPPGVGFTFFGLTVAVAISLQVATSTLIGALLPIGARAIKMDPAVIAAPAITTMVDVTGMVIYFTVARGILGL